MERQNYGGQNLVESLSQNEMDIQALIERWARAVREGDMAGIRADHDSVRIDVRCASSILAARVAGLQSIWAGPSPAGDPRPWGAL